jgi:hypothetical protein
MMAYMLWAMAKDVRELLLEWKSPSELALQEK